MRNIISVSSLALFATLVVMAIGQNPSPPPKLDPKAVVFFEANIRPLLVKHCDSCHSSKAKQVMGGLKLDSRGAWMHGGTTGPVIVPGFPEKSLLIAAVQYGGKPTPMPPTGRLSDKEIALLIEWVKMGAPDPRENAAPTNKPRVIDIARGKQWWAFQPLKKTTSPKVKDANWSLAPLDNFILAKLEAKGLRPNPSADRRRLIRRVFFDILGLPPSPEEVEAFVADKRPDAYAHLIDSLLANPHYGERWGRHWLDLARFAESHGYEQDYDRPYAYTYRDFVIKALNSDMPYDQFVRWQVAGDEFEPKNPLALMATGFLGAGTHATQITKNQVEKERYDELDDMLSVTSTTFLGLTLGCARCHDHKFDPIPTRDYYRMLSTFTKTVRSDMDIDLDPEGYQKAKTDFDRDHAPLTTALAYYEKERLPENLVAWLKRPETDAQKPGWHILAITEAKSKGGAKLISQPDGSLLASGKNPDAESYTITVTTQQRPITAIRIEALSHPSFVRGGPGRAGNGNFALSDLRVTATSLDGKGNPFDLHLRGARATFEQQGLPVTAAIDKDPKSGWAVDPQFGKDHAAVFALETPLDLKGGVKLTFTLKFDTNTGHSIGRLRLSLSTLPKEVAFDALSRLERIDNARLALERGENLTAEDRAMLLPWFRTIDTEWKTLDRRVQEHLASEPKPTLQKAMICSEGVSAIRTHTQGGDFLEQTYILRRGDPNNKGEVATQGFLQALMRMPDAEKHWITPPPKESRTPWHRRSLANWLTDTEKGAGHLLARVIVNRLWQHHIGRGIVTTPSDFGAQGAAPSHPELLDYLASELIRNGWRLKSLHRQILLSATYKQSVAAPDPAKRKSDPDNNLFGVRVRQRLEAEVLRDAILNVAGLLDTTMYGPGTLDESMKRRSLYFFVKRSKLIPTMALFDAPNALQSIATRQTTTVAPQSLYLLNNRYVRDSAQAFARRLIASDKHATTTNVDRAYRLALGRPPSASETADARAFLEQQSASYHADNLPDSEGNALTDLCQILLSLNEFVFVE